MATFFPLLFFFLFLFLFPYTDSVNFQITRFDPTSGDIFYQGDAIPSVGAVELINKRTYVCRVGWATYVEKIPLWDRDTGKVADFTTHFTFTITTQGTNYGHGIAFFLAPVGFQMVPNSGGGFLGLYNTTTSDSTRNQLVHVEFDSFSNPEWEPSFEHVGINNNSIASAVITRWNASFHSGDPADVWISYNASTKNLSVHWNYQTTSTSKENTSLSYKIDLAEVLPPFVTVGFSATTGKYGERTALSSWDFKSSLDIKETSGNNGKRVRLIVGLSVSGGVLLAILAFVFLVVWRLKQKRREKTKRMNLASINDDIEKGAGPRRFSYKDLASATNNFSGERKLGEGGFGAVYRGYLPNLDATVAVKKISRGSRQGRKEYVTEVKVISQLRHRNLVQLFGWCHDGGEFLLVYEFMPNGSLDAHLFGRKSPLSWGVRYKISQGLASALLYLHEEWEQCVVHRDIKSSNVMLDSTFNVKLGDFGLARLMDHELGPQTTGLVGTLGYLAPEYVSTGRASKESDVYSFGIVALEIATGRKARDSIEKESQMGLVEWAWNLYGKGRLIVAADEKLRMEFDERQAECLMIVGLWCAHPDRSLRPSIRQVIQVLNFEATWPNLPTSMPVPVYHVVPSPSVSSGEPFISSSIEVGR
ncbi:hypothetical protein UlMin_038945 [Ulmus minor]